MTTEPQPGRPANLKWFFIAGLLLAIALMSYLGRQKNPFPSLAPRSQPSVAVIYFEPDERAAEATSAAAGDSLTARVAGRLRSLSGVRVIGPDSLALLRRTLGLPAVGKLPPDAALGLAARVAASRLLVGRFSQEGDSLRASARLIDGTTGRQTSAAIASGRRDFGWGPVADSLAARLAQAASR